MSWQDILKSMLVAGALYGGWKGMSLLLAREQRGGRKVVRYLWPSAMLVWSWLMLIATTYPVIGVWMGRSLDILLAVFFAANLPGAYVGNLTLQLLIDRPDLVKGVAASVAVWLTWFIIIRIWEWWRERHGEGPVGLPPLG